MITRLGLIVLTAFLFSTSAMAAPKGLLSVTQKGRQALVRLVHRLFDPSNHSKKSSLFQDEVLDHRTPAGRAQLKSLMLKQANRWSPKNPKASWFGGVREHPETFPRAAA